MLDRSVERYCPTGNHFRHRRYFQVNGNGKLARDCHDCETARARHHKHTPNGNILQTAVGDAEFPGLDMDAIYRSDWFKKRNRSANNANE